VRWVEARATAAEVSLAVVTAAMDRSGPSGQVLQGIRHGAGSPCERSPEIDVNAFHFYLNLPASTCIYLYILAAVS